MIILTYIISMGWKIAISEGMLLEKIGNWGEAMVDKGWKVMNMIVCPWCICTLMSVVAHAAAFGLGILPMEWNWQLLIRWPLVVMGGSLLSGMTWTIYETINRVKERNETQEEFYDEELLN